MKRLALTATTLALLAAPVLANGSETFRAQGNEPSWSIRMSDGAMTFQPMDGEAVTVKPIPTPRQDGTTDIYEAKVGADSFALSVASKICTDTMSGMPFPKSVTVALGAKDLQRLRRGACNAAPGPMEHHRDRWQAGNRWIIAHHRLRGRWKDQWQCLVQPVLRRLHADWRRSDCRRSRCIDDDVRADADGPGDEGSRYPERSWPASGSARMAS